MTIKQQTNHKTHPELTHLLKLSEKDIKRVIIILLNMLKKLSRDMEDTKQNQFELSEIKNYNVKNRKKNWFGLVDIIY